MEERGKACKGEREAALLSETNNRPRAALAHALCSTNSFSLRRFSHISSVVKFCPLLLFVCDRAYVLFRLQLTIFRPEYNVYSVLKSQLKRDNECMAADFDCRQNNFVEGSEFTS